MLSRKQVNNYLPPTYHLYRLPGESSDPWQAVPPVPLLTDQHGEEIPARNVQLRLAYDREALYLCAESLETPEKQPPDLSPGSDEFWMQDHVEFRFLPEPAEPSRQIQFIFATDGRWWDSEGLWNADGGVTVEPGGGKAGWGFQCRMPWDALGLPSPQAGDVLSGILAHTKWTDGHADIAGISATELGFNQAARFARFVFDAAGACPVALNGVRFPEAARPAGVSSHSRLERGDNPAIVTVANHSGQTLTGRLMIRRDDGAGTSGEERTVECTLHPGENEMPVMLVLKRPLFRRFRFAFEYEGLRRELGSVSLRAAVPDLCRGECSQEHPYLCWTQENLALAREKTNNAAFERFTRILRGKADELPAPPDTEQFAKLDRPGQLKYLARGVGECLKGWILGTAPQHVQRATEYVEMGREMQLPDQVDLREGMAIGRLGIAYDAFAGEMRDEDRRLWIDVLSRFLELYLKTARTRHWNSTTIANANPVCNGGGGLLALALLGDHEDAEEALYLTRKLIRQYIDYCYGTDGGCTEGAQYWQYGMSNYLRFAWGLEQVIGTDDGLLRHPAVERNTNMIRLALSNDGKLHGVNDTIPLPVGSNVAMFLAGRFDDDFALWYADLAEEVYARIQREGKDVPYQSPAEWAMLFRPNKPRREKQSPLPRAVLLESIQYATIRSDTNYDCRLVAGLKGSRPPYTHHNQPDAGSFFLHVRGERLLIDPGYYKDEPTHHNLPVIDGVAPEEPQEFVAEIERCESHPGLRLATCNSTRAYRGAARSVRRCMVMVGEEGLVVLDDIVPHGERVDVTAHYQGGGPTEAGGEGIVQISGAESRVNFQVLGDRDRRMRMHGERALDDIHWGYKFAECRWFPMSVEYKAVAADPLVTVILDATDGDPGPANMVRTRDAIVVALPSGREVRFVWMEGGWRVDAAYSAE